MRSRKKVGWRWIYGRKVRPSVPETLPVPPPALEADVGDEGIGEVDLGAIRWPLFVLDENLQPAPHRAFRFCVCLRDADGTAFALACDAFEVVAADELQLRPLPDCMRAQNTPFEASALIADEAALRLDLTALSRHLERLG